MWIDWRELSFVVTALGVAAAFIWGFAHLG